MKYFLIGFYLLLFLFSQISFAEIDKATRAKMNLTIIARLESLRDECLLKNSGNQHLCRKRVLKQCRDTLQKKECIGLMGKMSKNKLPKTDGPSPI
jgi:hypothetical protein